MIKNVTLTSAGVKILESTQNGSDLAMVVAFLCNTSTVDTDTVSVFVVPSGSTAGDSNVIIKEYVIAPADTLELESEKIILSGGDFIFAKSTKGTTNATVSYMEI